MYGVVTAVDPDDLAMAMDVFLDAKALGGSSTDPPVPIGEALGNPMLMLYVQSPVWTLGELLVIGPDDRDQFTRKPGKWGVTVEYFDNIEDAVARMREVL